jgi:hypothetical protein
MWECEIRVLLYSLVRSDSFSFGGQSSNVTDQTRIYFTAICNKSNIMFLQDHQGLHIFYFGKSETHQY